MKNFYTALMTKFNATVAGSHNAFWTAIPDTDKSDQAGTDQAGKSEQSN